MSLIQKAAEHLMPANTVKSVVAILFGTFVCIWLTLCLVHWEAVPPLRMVTEVATYLGANDVGKVIAPVERWCAKPERHGLFLGAAAVATLLFNLSAAQLTFKQVAADFGWLFTMVAAQGIGLRDTAFVVVSLSLGLFLLVLLHERFIEGVRPVGSTYCVSVLRHNVFVASVAAVTPLFLLGSWLLSIYDDGHLRR